MRPRQQLLESLSVETPGMDLAAADAALDLPGRELSAVARIEGSAIGIAGPRLARRLPAGDRIGDILA
jgi:hypothetical protein